MPVWVPWLVGFAGFLLGAAGCVGLAVVEWTAWVLVLPGRRPGALGEELAARRDPNAHEASGTPVEAVAADGVRLAGSWHAAHPPGPSRGMVLVLHGFAEDPSAMHERVAALHAHGWDVAAVDTRAHGRSGGDRGSFGGREGADVSAWIDALTATHRRDADNHNPAVAVWGRSMGAAIAARAAADDPRIAAVVLEAPYVDLAATLTDVLRRKHLPLPGLLARLALHRAARLAGVSLARPRPIDSAARIDRPALVVHGTDDTLIPLADARRLARSFPRPAPFIEVAGAGHGNVVETGGPPLLDRIATFLDEATAPRSAARSP
jgi:alpha-beta hydrolase superfamily lysophospholipase